MQPRPHLLLAEARRRLSQQAAQAAQAAAPSEPGGDCTSEAVRTVALMPSAQHPSQRPHAAAQPARPRRLPVDTSIIARFRAGALSVGSSASPTRSPARRMIAARRAAQRLEEAVVFDGTLACLRVDDGRMPFTKALTAFGWDQQDTLEVWWALGRVYVARVDPALGPVRGVTSTLDPLRRLLITKPMLTALGIQRARADISMVLDRSREIAVLEDPARMLARAYGDLYADVSGGPCDAGLAQTSQTASATTATRTEAT